MPYIVALMCVRFQDSAIFYGADRRVIGVRSVPRALTLADVAIRCSLQCPNAPLHSVELLQVPFGIVLALYRTTLRQRASRPSIDGKLLFS